MYAELQGLTVFEQAEKLTAELIRRESYTNTDGERKKAEFIKGIISTFPYFKARPDFCWEQEIEGDPFSRKNVFAFIKGKGKQTILYHAHFDTVGIEDYGTLKPFAHDPEGLQAFFAQYEADGELWNDARSGDWLFGRGALDMQSGIAVHLANLLYFSEHPGELDGNLLVLFNADEEGQHTGIRAALAELLRLKAEHGIQYRASINNDFISPLFDGDTRKYIYAGTAGKLLPCFYIAGREAHAGESLAGLDPTIVASELNLRISQNFNLAEKVEDELILPPSCLYMKDDKKSYDVQTAVSCKLYFNYFIYNKSPVELMKELKMIAMEACAEAERRLSESYELYRRTNSLPGGGLDWGMEVITFSEMIHYLDGLGLDPVKAVRDSIKEAEEYETDERMLAFAAVEALHRLDPEKKPRTILFFAPPFLPANHIKGGSILSCLEEVLKEEAALTGEEFKLRKYFPYLSDASFLSYSGTDNEIGLLKQNFPAMDELFPVPLKEMKTLDIPSLNIGVYGKGGHKWTERVYKPYTFGILPDLIRKLTVRLLQNS
jgi:arginine utilization protein RocB